MLHRKFNSILKDILQKIEINDPSSFTFNGDENNKEKYYNIRNNLIYEAIFYARSLKLKAGFCIHTPVQEIIDKNWDYRWGVVAYIELPTGQVSWHIESPDIKYDGHTYKDKHERIKNFINDEFIGGNY